MRRVVVVWVVGVVLVATATCSSSPPLQSTNTAPLRSDEIQQGTRYALPLRLLTIQIWQGTIAGTGEAGDRHVKYAVLASTTDVPDPRYQYLLGYRGDALSHDQLSWQVQDGFLASVKAKTKDESLGALESAVKLFIEVAKAATALGGAATPGAKVEAASQVLLAQYVIDPLSPLGERRIKEIAEKHKIMLALHVRGVNGCDLNPQQPGCGQGAPACVPGIAYRAEYPYVLTMAPMALVKGTAASPAHEYLEHGEQVIMLPNRSPVTIMPLTRAAFVEQNMELTFTKGVLTKVVVDKPSQLKSFFDSLIEPVRAVASIPGELLKVRIEQNNNSINYMKNEAQLMAEMRAFLEAQKQHQAWMAQHGAAGGNSPGLGN